VGVGELSDGERLAHRVVHRWGLRGVWRLAELAAGFAACGDDGADSPTQAGTTTQAIRRRKRLPFRKC
jgi:hypothetical protein